MLAIKTAEIDGLPSIVHFSCESWCKLKMWKSGVLLSFLVHCAVRIFIFFITFRGFFNFLIFKTKNSSIFTLQSFETEILIQDEPNGDSSGNGEQRSGSESILG